MKILLLSLHYDAEHQVVRALESAGAGVLIAENAKDAWALLQLHGSSIDLAVIEREGDKGGEPGVEFAARFKEHPEHADLPYILLTKDWSDDDCARHQEGAAGANAYLRTPLEPRRLVELIEEVVGPLSGPLSSAPQEAEIAFVSEPSLVVEGAFALGPEPRTEFKSEPKPEPQPEPDSEAEQVMPYLYPDRHVVFSEPLGDAVVPGGAVQSPDMETLKKYLLLREQDVAALSSQLKSAHEHGRALEDAVRRERARVSELEQVVERQAARIQDFETEKQSAIESMQKEIDELNFQLKAKRDKARLLEKKLTDTHEDMERLKERVRNDIRKIRVREKELENRLEILKKDSEALLTSRENKIIELKRKLDTLEFNLDLLQDQYGRERENAAQLRQRLDKASRAMRVAGGFLDEGDNGGEGVLDERETAS